MLIAEFAFFGEAFPQGVLFQEKQVPKVNPSTDKDVSKQIESSKQKSHRKRSYLQKSKDGHLLWQLTTSHGFTPQGAPYAARVSLRKVAVLELVQLANQLLRLAAWQRESNERNSWPRNPEKIAARKETRVKKPTFGLVFAGNQSIPGLLGWCETDFVHAQKEPNSLFEFLALRPVERTIQQFDGVPSPYLYIYIYILQKKSW